MTWLEAKQPIIGLSPMADFTDSPFCVLIRETGAQTVLFREMLSAEALVRGNARTIEALDFLPLERPIVQQLFGSDPDSMARAAEFVMQKTSPDGIDLNMGCPVYKAVSNWNGASLMREPRKAVALIKAVKSAISVPLTVKTRLGWSKPTDIIEFSKVLQEAGADAITIHARTKEQAYAGTADWKAVAEVTKNLQIPVFINGDITDLKNADQALLESGAQGFLIGRGALGRPWIFKQLEDYYSSKTLAQEPDLSTRLRLLRRHAELQIAHYGESGLIKLRKHFPWYFKGIPSFRQYRAEAVHVTKLEDLDGLIQKILNVDYSSSI